jgi:hypothetical protein
MTFSINGKNQVVNGKNQVVAGPRHRFLRIPIRRADVKFRRHRVCPRFEPIPRQFSEALGGRSKKISQICVVWGKAVALSRLEPPNLRFDPIASFAASLCSGGSEELRSETARRPVGPLMDEAVEAYDIRGVSAGRKVLRHPKKGSLVSSMRPFRPMAIPR